MDITPQDHKDAGVLLGIGIIHTIAAWITFANAQAVAGFGATIVTIICGVLAGRYYWHQGNLAKKKAEEIE